MSQKLSSAYVGLNTLLSESGHFITPAELQGSLWGRTVAGAEAIQTLQDMAIILDEGELTDPIKQAINGLQEMINKELTDGSIAITLLLPSDDDQFITRLQALISWCQGFLSGFGLVKQQGQLPTETMEILEDIASITQLQTDIAKEDEARSEGDYMELIEYLRVAPLLIYGEVTKQQQNTTPPQAIH